MAIFAPPCTHSFQYDEPWCSSFCLNENSIFVIYQLVVNEIFFTVLIGLFSVSLVIRIILQKHIRRRQPIQWRKHRKMTIQLLAIAGNYLVFHLPDMIILIAKPFDPNSDFGITFEIYISFVNYFAELFLPFICLAALYPKPWRRQNRSVGAETMLNTVHSVRRIHA
jgi:phosphatidylglycerophosphate synthase